MSGAGSLVDLDQQNIDGRLILTAEVARSKMPRIQLQYFLTYLPKFAFKI